MSSDPAAASAPSASADAGAEKSKQQMKKEKKLAELAAQKAAKAAEQAEKKVWMINIRSCVSLRCPMLLAIWQSKEESERLAKAVTLEKPKDVPEAKRVRHRIFSFVAIEPARCVPMCTARTQSLLFVQISVGEAPNAVGSRVYVKAWVHTIRSHGMRWNLISLYRKQYL